MAIMYESSPCKRKGPLRALKTGGLHITSVGAFPRVITYVVILSFHDVIIRQGRNIRMHTQSVTLVLLILPNRSITKMISQVLPDSIFRAQIRAFSPIEALARSRCPAVVWPIFIFIDLYCFDVEKLNVDRFQTSHEILYGDPHTK